MHEATATVEERVRSVLAREFPSLSHLSRIDEDQDLFDLVDINSQSLLGLMVALEREFQIKINESTLQIDEIRAIGRLTALVGGCMGDQCQHKRAADP